MNEMGFGRKIKDSVASVQHSGGSGYAQEAEWALPELRLSLGECRHAEAETGAEAQPASFSFRLIGFSFVLWNLTALVVTFRG